MQLLLYLNRDTWQDENYQQLAQHVRDARRAGMPIVMLHERDPAAGAVDFELFLEVTPHDLLNDGLYQSIAIAWHPGVFRQTCAAMVWRELAQGTVKATTPTLRALGTSAANAMMRIRRALHVDHAHSQPQNMPAATQLTQLTGAEKRSPQGMEKESERL